MGRNVQRQLLTNTPISLSRGFRNGRTDNSGPIAGSHMRDALWPELAGQRRAFEVVVTVPRGDGGEPLVPRALPPEVLGCWSADQVAASVAVLAARPSGAVAAAEALVPELTWSAGAVVTVRAAGASGIALARPACWLRGCPPAWAVAVAADIRKVQGAPWSSGTG
jgi:hypothetical protein